MLRVTEQDKTNALVLETDEWDRVVDLWSKAEGTRAADWRVVGEVRDTQPSDPTRLVILGGPGVRFVVSSPHAPTVTYELSRHDFGRFEAAAGQVSQALRRLVHLPRRQMAVSTLLPVERVHYEAAIPPPGERRVSGEELATADDPKR